VTATPEDSNSGTAPSTFTQTSSADEALAEARRELAESWAQLKSRTWGLLFSGTSDTSSSSSSNNNNNNNNSSSSSSALPEIPLQPGTAIKGEVFISTAAAAAGGGEGRGEGAAAAITQGGGDFSTPLTSRLKRLFTGQFIRDFNQQLREQEAEEAAAEAEAEAEAEAADLARAATAATAAAAASSSTGPPAVQQQSPEPSYPSSAAPSGVAVAGEAAVDAAQRSSGGSTRVTTAVDSDGRAVQIVDAEVSSSPAAALAGETAEPAAAVPSAAGAAAGGGADAVPSPPSGAALSETVINLAAATATSNAPVEAEVLLDEEEEDLEGELVTAPLFGTALLVMLSWGVWVTSWVTVLPAVWQAVQQGEVFQVVKALLVTYPGISPVTSALVTVSRDIGFCNDGWSFPGMPPVHICSHRTGKSSKRCSNEVYGH
jgi:hypothetical protein